MKLHVGLQIGRYIEDIEANTNRHTLYRDSQDIQKLQTQRYRQRHTTQKGRQTQRHSDLLQDRQTELKAVVIWVLRCVTVSFRNNRSPPPFSDDWRH